MDATKRPVRIPPEFATYAEKHELFELHKNMLEQLLIKRPDNPIKFFIEILKRENENVPQIIILGGASTGKASIARMICTKLRCANLCPSTLLNEAESQFKNPIEDFIAMKKQVPAEPWVNLLVDRVNQFDCVKKGWVLHGFPENREQAVALQAVGIFPKHYVLLDANDDMLVERASGKRYDPVSGDVFHTTYDMPSNRIIADRLLPVPGNDANSIIARLNYFRRNVDGINEAYRGVYKLINADQPKADIFAEVMSYVNSSPRSTAPHTPRIILLGATGAGKSIQAALLASKYNLVNIRCGKLIKQEMECESNVGMACKTYVDKQDDVPDAILLGLLDDRLSQLDCVSRGWVLHGYPRSREQAEQLCYAGHVPNRVFNLDVPNNAIMERLTLRSTDPITGERYHSLYNPPRTEAVKLRLRCSPRDSDTEVRRRIARYNAYVEEIGDYFMEAQHINADQDPHTVFELLESIIVNPLPKQI